ncbi:hypothetical protein Fuma_03550 [Fuerstiella marisgermanici]|uniref:Uncharacterized protein n=1 Tax=Fuerstiella marisgermanici TaxID=1891926 RepID=A0A1P8WIN7_9PLAN|nr:hypothetical protein Fuma_03550 [Fuerstiella marisgermanici]
MSRWPLRSSYASTIEMCWGNSPVLIELLRNQFTMPATGGNRLLGPLVIARAKARVVFKESPYRDAACDSQVSQLSGEDFFSDEQTFEERMHRMWRNDPSFARFDVQAAFACLCECHSGDCHCGRDGCLRVRWLFWLNGVDTDLSPNTLRRIRLRSHCLDTVHGTLPAAFQGLLALQ